MTSIIDPLLQILKDPSAKALFVLDTTGSAMGSDLHDQAFAYLALVRERFDPQGLRSAAITDKFARIGGASVEPALIPLSARAAHHIPQDQISYAGGGAQHPLEAIGSTSLFQGYQPTHLVFIGDLFDQAPKPADMALPPEKVLFLMWNSAEKQLEQAVAYYKEVGQVAALPNEQQVSHLLALEDAKELEQNLNQEQPARPRHRF